MSRDRIMRRLTIVYWGFFVLSLIYVNVYDSINITILDNIIFCVAVIVMLILVCYLNIVGDKNE